MQLHRVNKRTWAVFADEEQENKFFWDEVECWALVEHVRKCKKGEAPTLFVGKTPCVRETVIRALFMDEMTTRAEAENFLGYSKNPGGETAHWCAKAEKYFAEHQEGQSGHTH